MTEYCVPTGPGEAELVEKRSRFLGHLRPAETEEEARAFLAEMKKKYYDARHNCWCYRLRGGVERYSDDGEPQGSAGLPMLEVLRREGVTDAVCVVTRYFGGVLLGAPGLTRAYSSSAAESVKNAKLLHFCEAFRIRYVIDYTNYGKVSYLLPEFETVDAGSDFGEKVTLLFDIKTSLYPALEAKLTETFNCRPALEQLETHFVSFP